MENLLFCENHPQKIAKRHCDRCDQNLCNECIFESHIEHHDEITKIEYRQNTQQNKLPEIVLKDIKLIIDKSFNDLKPQIYKLVLEETEKYIKDHKNLQLKVNQKKEEKHVLFSIKKEVKPNSNFYQNLKKFSKENKETPIKKFIIRSNTVGSRIKERARMFDFIDKKEISKHYDENNPFNKKVDQNKQVKALAKMFENK